MIALGAVCLLLGDFPPGQPVPENFFARAVLVYIAAAIMLVGGAAIEWRRTTAWGAGVITAYFAVIVVLLMNGSVLLEHYTEFGTYESIAIELAIAVGGMIVFVKNTKIDAALSARLTRICQLTFGICALIFGGAHFIYMNLTAPLVPEWLPPSQEFWAYATGLGFIAAGAAILLTIQARLAAVILTIMVASFTPLVHLPMLFADPSSQWIWGENAVNIAMAGAAWVVADSFTLSAMPPTQ